MHDVFMTKPGYKFHPKKGENKNQDVHKNHRLFFDAAKLRQKALNKNRFIGVLKMKLPAC